MNGVEWVDDTRCTWLTTLGASGRSTFLVATDVAARGLDIPKVALRRIYVHLDRYKSMCFLIDIYFKCF